MVGKILAYISKIYKYIFDYAIPPANKNEWTPLRSIVSLIIAPTITCISFGRIFLLIFSWKIFWVNFIKHSFCCLVQLPSTVVPYPYDLLHCKKRKARKSKHSLLYLFLHYHCMLDYGGLLNINQSYGTATAFD